MCKVIGFTNFQKVRKKLDTVEYLGRLLLSTERDGFGYSMWDKNSKSFFGERTAEKTFSSISRENPRVDFSFCNSTVSLQNKFGEIDFTNVGAAIFHGRISTNSKTLLNTHPIVKSGMSLIHNGVVTDHGTKYPTITSNDSEHVLERYVDGTFENNLTGYYAFLSIDTEGKLHVCRDKIAPLFSTWIDSLDTYLFSTNEDNIIAICKALSVEYSSILKVKDDNLIVFEENRIVSTRPITSKGWSVVESAHSKSSLGYDLDSWTSYRTTPSYQNPYQSAASYKKDAGIVSKAKKAKAAKSEIKQKKKKKPYEPLTKDEQNYLAEVYSMDKSYTIINKKGNEVRLEVFQELPFSAMKHFEVIRGDGTVVCWQDWESERLSSRNS